MWGLRIVWFFIVCSFLSKDIMEQKNILGQLGQPVRPNRLGHESAKLLGSYFVCGK